MSRRSPRALLLCAALLGPAAFAAAAQDADVLLARGRELVAQDACERALPVFEAASEVDPRDGRAAAWAGRCLIRLQRYDEAVTRLETALQTAPVPGRARLDYVVALYHTGEVVAAEDALEEARRTHQGEAELALYDGMVLLERGRPRRAAELLAQARTAGGASVEPVASFYEGVAWSRVAEQERAEEAFSRVKRRDPDGPWSRLADRSLGKLQRPSEGKQWLTMTVGGEWDSNVPLKGDGVILPGAFEDGTGLSDEEGSRFVWGLNGGTQVLAGRDWAVGVALRYAGTAHTDHGDDHDDFDMHFPVGSVWFDRRINELMVAQFQYDSGYAFVGGDSYLYPHALTSALYFEWGNGHATRLFARGHYRDYKFEGPDDVPATAGGSVAGDVDEARDRQRDARALDLGIAHQIPLALLATHLNVGYVFRANEAKGEEYDYRAHELRATTSTALPWDMALELLASYAYKPHLNRSTFPDLPAATPYVLSEKKRRDRITTWQVVLERALSESLTAGARYRFVHHGSNVDPFDYDNGIAGAYLTMKLR